MAVKVFQLNDYEWWAAESIGEVIPAAMAMSGMSRKDLLDDDDEPLELTAEDMERLKFDWDETRDPATYITFQEALDRMIKEGIKFPNLFASTEY